MFFMVLISECLRKDNPQDSVPTPQLIERGLIVLHVKLYFGSM